MLSCRRRLLLEHLEERTLLSYSFTLLADTTEHYRALPHLPAISCDGTVAYNADLRPDGQAILTSDGRVIATNNDELATLATSPPINCAGTVAFRAGLVGGGMGVFMGDGGKLVRIADTTGVFRNIRGTPAINDAGYVSFRANLTSGGEGFFIGNGGLPAILYVSGGQFSGFPIVPGSVVGTNLLNNAGQIAFRASLSSGGEGMFLGDGGPVTTIADTLDGTFTEFTHVPALNDLGQVFFRANHAKGGQVMLLGDGKGLTTVADTSGPYSSFIVRSSLNNLGGVVFGASLDAGGSGLFTGPDPIEDKVLAVGDPLLGSTVNVVGCFASCLNDAGQIAIRAALVDGRQVIVRADPMERHPASTVNGAADILAAILVSERDREVGIPLNPFPQV